MQVRTHMIFIAAFVAQFKSRSPLAIGTNYYIRVKVRTVREAQSAYHLKEFIDKGAKQKQYQHTQHNTL